MIHGKNRMRMVVFYGKIALEPIEVFYKIIS